MLITTRNKIDKIIIKWLKEEGYYPECKNLSQKGAGGSLSHYQIEELMRRCIESK